MSTTVENQTFEAELVEAGDLNPYQSPIVAEPVAEISAGVGRATPAQIDSVRQSLIAAEITFVTHSFFQILGLTNLFGITQALPTPFGDLAYFGSAIAALICFAAMVVASNRFDLTSLASICLFPIPLFGALLYFGFKQRASRFLIWNGYRPGFLGASLDDNEIRIMNSDPLYRPNARYREDGSKRRIENSLSDWFIIAIVGAALLTVIYHVCYYSWI